MSDQQPKIHKQADVEAYRLPDFDESGEPAEATKESRSAPEDFVLTLFGDEEERAVQTLAEAEKLAEEILAKARDQAANTESQARAEADRVLEEAAAIRGQAEEKGRLKGLEEGTAQGRKEGREKFEAEAAPLLQGLKNIHGLYENLWQVNEAGLVKLAIRIAERVLLHELTTSPETISGVFKAALDLLQEQHQAVFRINPDDLGLLESLRKDLRDEINGLVNIVFQSDPGLNRGEFIMETEAGRLDATLRRRLDAVTGPVDEMLSSSFNLDW